MKFIKKWGSTIVIVLLLVVLAVVLLVGYKAITEYKDTIAQQQASIDDMSQFINEDIGELINSYVLKESVRVGDILNEEMFEAVTIPEKVAYTNKEVEVETVDANGKTVKTTELQKALSVVTNLNSVLGKKFRIDLDQGAILMNDFIIDEPVKNDERKYQLVLDRLPTDLQVYDYVDLRIQLTYGQDFIAISHKRVEDLDLENNLITFIFNENEINTYNSMLLDRAMYNNVEVYALKYIDTTSQTAAESYYPVNKNIAEILAINPNIINTVKKEMQLERAQLNSIMGGDIDTYSDRELETVQREINQFRTQVSRDISGAIRQRIRAEQEAARQAARNGG